MSLQSLPLSPNYYPYFSPQSLSKNKTITPIRTKPNDSLASANFLPSATPRLLLSRRTTLDHDMDTGCDSLVGDEFAIETVRSPSSAKKQRREDTPEPPSLVEEETDPRSEIKVYKYDSDVEDDSDGMHEMTEKEYEEYHRQLEESEGFEVMDFPRSFSCGLTFPVRPQNEFWGQLKPLSELALKEYNEKQGMNLEFVKVVKANAVPVAGLRYYITFDVKDGDHVVDGNTTREFQAHVWDGIGHTEVLFCRPKSTT